VNRIICCTQYRLLTSLVVAGLVLTPALVSAEEQRIRALIDQTLEQLETSVEPLELTADRDYALSADGATYTATFQHFGLAFDEGAFEAGPVIVTLTVLDGDEISIDTQIANTLTLHEGDELIGELSIGGQALSGTWSEPLEAFRLIDITLEDLYLQVSNEPFEGRIGYLSVQQQLDVATDATWQQAQDLRLDDLQLMIMETDIRLSQLSSGTQLAGKEYPQLRELLARLNELAEQAEALDMTAEAPDAALESVIPLFETLSEMSKLIDHYRGSLAGRELTMHEAKDSLGGLDQFTIHSSADNRGELPELGFSLSMDGARSPTQTWPPELLPRSAHFELRLRHIPEDLFNRILHIGLDSEGVHSDLQALYWQQQLLGVLMESALELRIPDTFIATDLSRTDLDLRAAVAPDTLFGGVGELNLYITNMEALIEATGAGQNPTIAPMLAMITAFSERRQGEDGQTVDAFELAVTEQGRLMLNNKDITALLMPQAQ
jgi:hypothetical protein